MSKFSEEIQLIEQSGLFDPAWYIEQYQDVNLVGVDPIRHYLWVGARLNRDPSPDFDTAHYVTTYPDVNEGEENPLVHYIKRGRNEGRQARLFDFRPSSTSASSDVIVPVYNALDDVRRCLEPLSQKTDYCDQMKGRLTTRPLADLVNPKDLDTVRDAFDQAFYRMNNSDLGEADDEALLVHYMAVGWRERRDPRPDFSTRYYIDTYPDIARGNINPFLHFILFGKAEGRKPRGDEPMRLFQAPGQSLTPEPLRAVMMAANHSGKSQRTTAKINPDSLTQHWIIPDFRPGAGGHMTIFRMIKFQEIFGHRCKIWIEAPRFHKSAEAAWETIVKHFQCIGAEVDFVENGFLSAKGDAVVATGWSTAYLARAATGFHERFYFVQDHEVEFYPTGSERLLAAQTYGFGLSCICASPWLERIMREDYGQWARSFHLAYDAEIYTPAGSRGAEIAQAAGPLRIAVYARDHTARRCVALSLMALEWLAARRDDFEVHFFGQDELPFVQTSFAAVTHGVLSPEKLADLYRACDLGICFSGTNYSLVPQEMMACGLPVVELDGDSTRAIFPKGVVTLAGPGPLDIAAKLEALLDDAKLRARQAERGRKWAAGFSWEGSARIVEGALRDRLTETKSAKIAAPARTGRKQTALDVVIPTWNGMDELEPVIAALRRQSMAEAIQIHCIDSSSSDGTAEWLRAQPDIALIEIDQAEFQHGRTRNQAAAAGKAPIIAFLTQDAIPATPTWAHDICTMFAHVPQAAGLFGRHLPYPHHPEWVRREIEGHFDNMLKHPLVLSRDTDPEKWAAGDQGWRQLLHFYSDNNSAMRRAVWADIPYPEVDYGEDQVWARDIIEAGLTKLYAPTACVYHSHDYDPVETFKRALTEAAFFFTHFGYVLGDGSEEELAARISNEQAAYRGWAYRHPTTPEEEALRLNNIEAKHRGWQAGLDEARGGDHLAVKTLTPPT